MRPDSPDLRPDRPDEAEFERLDLRLDRPDLSLSGQILEPERLDSSPERPDLRPEGVDELWNERTNESPPVFYRTSSPSGPLPKNTPEGNMWRYPLPCFA